MPANSSDYQKEYMRAYRQANRDKTRGVSKRLASPFVGVDGEGGDTDQGYHAYWLLRVGPNRLVPHPGKIRLSSQDCLSFLCDQPRDKTYVVYFGDYDVTKWLEDLPFETLKRLMDRSKRMYGTGPRKILYPQDWREFEIEYLPRKEFKVRRIGEKDWFVMNDVGSFFQTSFVEAIKLWKVGTEEEQAMIAAEKARRGAFQFSDLATVDEYNALEIRCLQDLMGKFRDACVQAGIVPTKWQGPGLLAEALFRKHNVALSKDVPLLTDVRWKPLLEFARNAFYGGRPEIMAVGPCDRPVYQFDINSAYPYAMKFVPCLEHGVWTYAQAPTGFAEPLCTDDSRSEYAVDAVESGSAVLTLVYGSFTPLPTDSGRAPLWYGLPFRTATGTITYPASGKGWYWSFEVGESRHQKFNVEESWTYQRRCSCTPLAFVEDVYEERKRLGKDGPGIILKLALNSMYGKRVQSIGSPKYADPIIGSFITAFCRAMIQRTIHGSTKCRTWCGSDVLMIATDSLCTTNRRPDLIESTTLGGWSKETHGEGMFIVQPGLYFGSSGKRAKTRGVPLAVITEKEQEFRDGFAAMVRDMDLSLGDVRVPQKLFAGIRYAIHRRNVKLLGQWLEFVEKKSQAKGKVVRFDWSSKRAELPVLSPNSDHNYLITFPPQGDPDAVTLPYSKDIGGLTNRDEARIAFMDQPDWVQPLFTEE